VRVSAEKNGMAVRLAALLPRFIVLTLLWLLTTATLTFAAEKRLSTPPKASSARVTGRPVVVVPDVTGQAYVFAKGMLEDAGFAWRVGGSVQGYAANVVAVQQPAAGTRVFDTGAPTIVLRLARGHYPESGLPDDASSFAGTRIRLVDVPVQAHPVAKPKAHALHPRVKPAHSKVKPAHAKKAAPRAPLARTRPAAFAVPGAPKEPLDEMTLPARAELLSTWVNAHQKPTNANVRHWLYQHAWLIEGAKFGWWHGAQALETLVAVDRRVEALWGIGYRSESVARATLARVRAQEAK
jgi:hypothetical protein